MMSIEFLKFGDIEIAKQKSHSSRNPVTTDDKGINKILISDKFACEKRVLSIFLDTKIQRTNYNFTYQASTGARKCEKF